MCCLLLLTIKTVVGLGSFLELWDRRSVSSLVSLPLSEQNTKRRACCARHIGRWLSHVELASPIYLRDRSVAQTSRAFYSGCLYDEACFTCLIGVSSDIWGRLLLTWTNQNSAPNGYIAQTFSGRSVGPFSFLDIITTNDSHSFFSFFLRHLLISIDKLLEYYGY